MAQLTNPERLEGGLLGLLIGDALGVPYEFKGPEEMPAREEIELTPPDWFPRSHAGVPPGTWSDDGAQALCLLASLLDKQRLDQDDFARRLVDWYSSGYMAVDGRVFDVGIQTAEVLRAIQAGKPPLEASRRDVHGNGNGSLMRVLPLALWHRGSDESLYVDARRSSEVTHGHVRSQLCCALYCLWARRILEDAAEPWSDAQRTLEELARGDDDASVEWASVIVPQLAERGTGTGYVVDTLRTTRAVMPGLTYETVVRDAVAVGIDTDTTAAVAGGVAGLRDGVQGIPARWRDSLRGTELVRPLLDQLLSRAS